MSRESWAWQRSFGQRKNAVQCFTNARWEYGLICFPFFLQFLFILQLSFLYCSVHILGSVDCSFFVVLLWFWLSHSTWPILELNDSLMLSVKWCGFPSRNWCSFTREMLNSTWSAECSCSHDERAQLREECTNGWAEKHFYISDTRHWHVLGRFHAAALMECKWKKKVNDKILWRLLVVCNRYVLSLKLFW